MKKRLLFCYISLGVVFNFLTTSVFSPMVMAQNFSTSQAKLPPIGAMLGISQEYIPTMIRGLKIDPEIPFRFQFFLDSGDSQLDDESLGEETGKLIRYFMASLTIPEKDLWVNLSPYENDRIINEHFGQTEMGIDLLAQDYVLKQLTASMFHPHHEIGKQFWQEYRKILAFHNLDDNALINTFNKIWIVPESGYFFEEDNTVYLKDAKLKVLIEEDYVALQEDLNAQNYGLDSLDQNNQQLLTKETKQLIREIVIPEIEREVNEGKNFAKLRQIYNAMLLSLWFKKRMKEHTLTQRYIDQKKIEGINVDKDEVVANIWQQYVRSFEVGVYNFIEEEYSPMTQEIIPHKYFSGGATALTDAKLVSSNFFVKYDKVVDVDFVDPSMLSRSSLIAWIFLMGGISDGWVYDGLSDPNELPKESKEVSQPNKSINPNITPISSIDDRLHNMTFEEVREWVTMFESSVNKNINTVTFENIMELLSVLQYMQPGGKGFEKFKTNRTMIQTDFKTLFPQLIKLNSSVIEKVSAREAVIKKKLGNFVSHTMTFGAKIYGVSHSVKPRNIGELIGPLWKYIDNVDNLEVAQKIVILDEIKKNLSILLNINKGGHQEASYEKLEQQLLIKKPEVLYVEETKKSLQGKLRTLQVTKKLMEALKQAGFNDDQMERLMLIILDVPFYFSHKHPDISINFRPSERSDLHTTFLKLISEAKQILEGSGSKKFAKTGFSRLSILMDYLLTSGEYVKILNYEDTQLKQFYTRVLSMVPPEARTVAMTYLEKMRQYLESIRKRDLYLMEELLKEKGDVIRGYAHVYTLQDLDKALLENDKTDYVGGINLRSDQAIIYIEEASNGFIIPQPDEDMLGYPMQVLIPNIQQIRSVPTDLLLFEKNIFTNF